MEHRRSPEGTDNSRHRDASTPHSFFCASFFSVGMAFLLALVNQWGRAATDKKKSRPHIEGQSAHPSHHRRRLERVLFFFFNVPLGCIFRRSQSHWSCSFPVFLRRPPRGESQRTSRTQGAGSTRPHRGTWGNKIGEMVIFRGCVQQDNAAVLATCTRRLILVFIIFFFGMNGKEQTKRERQTHGKRT